MLMCLSYPGKAFRRGMSQPCALAQHLGEALLSADSKVLGRALSETNTETIAKCVAAHCMWGHAVRAQSSLRSYFWASVVFRRGHMDFLKTNPHCIMTWQTCLLMRKSRIVVMAFTGVMEDWRKGKLLETMKRKKSQFVTHSKATEFYQISSKDNEVRILANILGNYYSNNWQKCFWACVGCCQVYTCFNLHLHNLSCVNISLPRVFNMVF